MKTALLALTCLLTIPSVAQQAATHYIQSGSRVFIEPMEGFETYLAAAIVKKQVPITVVSDRARADYIISGGSQVEKAGWAKMIFLSSGASRATASIAVKDAKTGDLIYAYAVDKFNSRRERQSHSRGLRKTHEAGHRKTS